MKIEKHGHTVLGRTVARGFGLPAQPSPAGDTAHNEVLPVSTKGLRGGAGQDLADQGLPACSSNGEAATDGGAEKLSTLGGLR
jgi:hypothetical protein